MPIERGIDVPAPAWPGPTISRSRLAGVAIALAVGSSSIVFSEPAVADVLMMGVIVGVPLLGVARFGRVTLANAGLWLVIVALGLAGTQMSVTFASAVTHQVVTLFLVLGAVMLAGFVAADPLPRARLVLYAYVAAAMLATIAGVIGYFGMLPGAFDLFTNFGRARGTFKDPNVYGAAVAPAVVACVWVILRESRRAARIALAIALPLVIGLLISFSRGAWISALLSIAILVAISVARTRRAADLRRFGFFAAIGLGLMLASLLAIMQVEQVRSLLEQRASLDQSYDNGPEGRFGGQAKARRLIVENPFGIGTHTFRDIHHKEEPHNVYLNMFLMTGWLGGLLYIVSVTATLAVGFRASLQRNALQGPMLIATAAFAGVAFEGYVIDSDHWRSFFVLLGLVWGLADARPPAADASRRQGD